MKYRPGWWTLDRSILGFPENATGYRCLWRQTYKVMYFLYSSGWGQAYILMHFLPAHLPPARDQAHLVQLGQPNLLREVKTCGLLPNMNTSLQYLRKYLSLGKGAYRIESFLFYGSLRRSNLYLKDNFGSHNNSGYPEPSSGLHRHQQAHWKCTNTYGGRWKRTGWAGDSVTTTASRVSHTRGKKAVWFNTRT